MLANQAKFSDLVNAGVFKNIGKKRHKATQIRKGTKQVKENPVMYCSGSNTNKESLVNSCESDTIVSAASSSQTNPTEAFDTFIAWKVNPRTDDSESATNYSQSFLPTPTRFIQQTTFHLEFNVNLNNNVSTLSTPLSQSRSTINSNLSEPERLFTTTSQQNLVISSNSLVSLQPTPYLDPLSDISPLSHFLILFLQRHNPVLVVVGICENTPLTKTSVCWKMGGAQSLSQNSEGQCTKIIKAVFNIRQIIVTYISTKAYTAGDVFFPTFSFQPLRYTSHTLL